MITEHEYDKAAQKWTNRLARAGVHLRKTDNLMLQMLIRREAMYKATTKKLRSVDDIVNGPDERAPFTNHYRLLTECEAVLFKLVTMFGLSPKHKSALQTQLLTEEGMRKAIAVREEKKEEAKKAEAEPAEAVKDFMEHFSRVS